MERGGARGRRGWGGGWQEAGGGPAGGARAGGLGGRGVGRGGGGWRPGVGGRAGGPVTVVPMRGGPQGYRKVLSASSNEARLPAWKQMASASAGVSGPDLSVQT